MGGLFSKPKIPPQPDPIPPPEKSDQQIQKDTEEQRKRFYGASSGRSSTQLTGATGVSGGYSSSAVKLLGGSGV